MGRAERTPDEPITVWDLLIEVRSDVKDLTRRLTRVEIGGAALTALAAWYATGKPSAAIPTGAVAVWQACRHFLPIF